MKSPRPCSYHQNATAVATSSASSALAIRLRSSVRCATSVIVAAGSRGGRRRRRRPDRRGGSLTVVPGEGSAGAVGRTGLRGTRPQLGGSGFRGPRLGLEGLALAVGRGRRREDLTAHRGRLGGVLGADVVVLHALHLALEDAQRAAEGARGVRQLLVTEEQQDGQDDQADLHRAEVHRVLRTWVASSMLRARRRPAAPETGVWSGRP